MRRFAMISLIVAVFLVSAYGFNREFDSHGCCISCGQFYCVESKKCMDDWDKCKVGTYDEKACTYTYTATLDQQTFHYDLSPYNKAADDYFTIRDKESHTGQTYEYLFRLCNKVDYKLLSSKCHKTRGSGGEVCTGSALAYQYYKTDWDYESCYHLSDCFTDGPRIKMGLLDPVKPASGIYLTYYGGNTCPQTTAMHSTCTTHTDSKDSAGTYCDRSFTININCHNEINEIGENEEIIEAAGCQYIATINHQMGCPVECPRDTNGRICSGRGECSYQAYDGGLDVDGESSPIQCTCNKGFYGNACEMTELQQKLSHIAAATGTSSSFLSLLIFVALFSVLVLILMYLERIKILASGLLYFFESTWSDTVGSADGHGQYAPVSRVDDSGLGMRRI